MSRTIRNRPKGKGKARDGDDLRYSRGCNHHGSCDWCANNRTHSARRQAPLPNHPKGETYE